MSRLVKHLALRVSTVRAHNRRLTQPHEPGGCATPRRVYRINGLKHLSIEGFLLKNRRLLLCSVPWQRFCHICIECLTDMCDHAPAHLISSRLYQLMCYLSMSCKRLSCMFSYFFLLPFSSNYLSSCYNVSVFLLSQNGRKYCVYITLFQDV